MNFVIYFLLTCELSILLGFFLYKDVTSCFENLLILQTTRIFNGLQYSFKVGLGFINVSESFSYNDLLRVTNLILAYLG